jgi:Zn-dependent membrane protease YugP
MRTLILLMMVFSLSAFAQNRVRENIKQQSIATSDDGSTSRTVISKKKEVSPKVKK